jgi:hypothetical protein
MSFSLKNSLLVGFLFLAQNLFCQFEKISIRNTSIEYETDLIDDTSNSYLKIMLCGDLIHRNHLMSKYAPQINGSYSYRSWFRQVKPLFFYPDFVVASLRSFFPNRSNVATFPNSAPDEYLAELEYTGFNVMMMGNSSVLTDRKTINDYTLKKLNYSDIFKVGFYKDEKEKNANYPLILEKKDIRVAFLNYSLDSVLLDLPEDQISFFQIDTIRNDVNKAKTTMLADYVIAYIDWAKQDSLKLGKVAELLQMGIDVIIGTGNGESFTTADLLSYSDGSLKLHVDNMGYFNAESNERERNKTAIVEIVLKKNKLTKQVSTHDMGFIPIWTLIDNERYSVLPISNIEEKHIQNINLNLIQYSAMKVAMTDMRFAFFDKIPELHYDYNDKTVNNVEQTSFIRKTLMREQDKINEIVRKNSDSIYASMFGSAPPPVGSLYIPYEDDWGMLKSKKEKAKSKENNRDTIEIYGQADELSPRGIINIKANHSKYQRERVKLLTPREKFIIDSTRQYNERFIIVDSLAELKLKLKKQKIDAAKRRDSLFKASLNPNFKSTYNPAIEPGSDAKPYTPKIQGGVFTTIDISKEKEREKEDNIPVKNIEEYFAVQIYTLSSQKELDLDKYPYFNGYEVKYEEGYYRYYVGRSTSLNLSKELYRSIKAKGHADAMLIRYTNGIRSVVKTAF